LTYPQLGKNASNLLTALTDLINLIFKGEIPKILLPIFFGASLCALKRKDGGVRPIAIGNTLRRLTFKIYNTGLVSNAIQYFLPLQFGVGVKGGAEGTFHSLRSFLKENMGSDNAVLKIDFKNAFNLVDRKCLLDVIAEKFPDAFLIIFQAYGTPLFLFFGCNTILSQKGVGQQDPLGPLLFNLIIHPLISLAGSTGF